MSWLSRIAVLTTTRAEFGLLRPLITALEAEPQYEVQLLVGGTHLQAAYGGTISEIEQAGFTPAARLDYLQGAASTLEAGARAMSLVGKALVDLEPDLLVLLGDRYETLAAATAALCVRLPVLHLHGGELTLGAIDDAARHAITKLSHLHGVASEEYRRRVCQLGEEPWRVRTVGAMGLAAMQALPDLSDEEIQAELGLDPKEPFLIVGIHPETLSERPPRELLAAVREGLASHEGPIVVTGCNADPGHEELRAGLREWVASEPSCCYRESLGQTLLFSLMRRAQALVGNTSSGILESPSFGLPTLNVGRRQEGRIRGANVLDVEATPQAVAGGLARALDPAFRQAAKVAPSPYGDGRAAEGILELLAMAGACTRQEIVLKGFALFPGETV